MDFDTERRVSLHRRAQRIVGGFRLPFLMSIIRQGSLKPRENAAIMDNVHRIPDREKADLSNETSCERRTESAPYHSARPHLGLGN